MQLLLRIIKYYQGESLGADFDRAIELEDQELKKLGRVGIPVYVIYLPNKTYSK